MEARFGTFFGGDGNLKGSGYTSFGGRQYLYYRNDDGTTVRAEPGQTVRLNGFPVRWNGGGTGRDSFEFVEPGSTEAAEAGEAEGEKPASAPEEARKGKAGDKPLSAEEKAKRSAEIRRGNAQRARARKKSEEGELRRRMAEHRGLGIVVP